MKPAARHDDAAAGAAPAAPGDELIYLYCVVEGGSEAERLLTSGEVPGLVPGRPLFPVAAEGLVAAASRVPAATFQEEPLNALLADLPRLAPYVVRHEEAVRTLLPAAPALVPLTFGAVYRDEARVEAMLRERAGDLRALLRRVAGKEEWGVKGFGEWARLLAAAEQESEAVRRLAEEARRAGPGRAYLLARRRERLLASAADRLAAEMAAAVVERLAGLSAAAHRDEALPAPPPGSPPLLLKAAFLVERGAADAFRALAADLAERSAPRGLHLELSGPWAPYTFVGERHGG